MTIHRASRTKPNPVRLAFFDYASTAFSPVKAENGAETTEGNIVRQPFQIAAGSSNWR